MNRQRLGQLALIVIVFVLAGPVVGLIVAAAASGAAIALGGDPVGGAAFAAFMLVYGWLFAHFVGLIPALIAGSLAAAFAWWRGRVPLTVGAAAGVAGMAQMVWQLGVPEPSWRESNFTAVAVIWLITHVVSSLVCTRLTRRWQ